MASRFESTSVSPAAFIVAAILVVLLVGTLVWFAIPQPNARHHFSAPSGKVSLDLGEQCAEETCARTAIVEIDQRRSECTVPLTSTHAVLLNAYPLWPSDEKKVDIVYTDAQGQGGKFTLDFARDCAPTQN